MQSTKMNDFDTLNSLKIKILELKKKRDEITTIIMRDRMNITQIDEQINALEREKQKIQMNSEEKEMQIRKFDELISQSESAVTKMVLSSKRLNDALSQALEDNL